MTGISSSIGLVSGIDSASIIEQLMEIERQPITTLEARLAEIDVQRAAFMELSARLLAIQNIAPQLSALSLFRKYSSASSNDSILTAQVGEAVAPGAYTFRVASLASTHAVVSGNYADVDTTPVGIGSLTIESNQAKVDQDTELSALHGGAGVRRGTISITDRSGATAEIDLSTAVTITDVLHAINSETSINVRASVTGLDANGATGDRIVLEDTNNLATLSDPGNLIVSDVGAGHMATDLGIASDVDAGRIDGTDLVRITMDTPLAALNDGNGVHRLRNSTDLVFQASETDDFNVSLSDILSLDTNLDALNSGNGVRLGTIRISTRDGASADVDLTGATTVNDVLDRIRNADLSVSATIVNSHIQLTDTSEAVISSDSDEDDESLFAFSIEDVDGHAAADLAIAQTTDDTGISGSDIYRVRTVGDVIRAINLAPGNSESVVVASIADDGKGIQIESSVRNNDITITAGSGSDAAADLGLLDMVVTSGETAQTRRLISGLNTVLLQSLAGGAGIETGSVRFTDRTGQSTTIDFSGVDTLNDIIDLINADGTTGLRASINQAGNGIQIEDTTGSTSNQIIIEDVDGTMAAQMGIALSATPDQPYDSNVVNSGSLHRAYISRETALSDLNNGRGVQTGTFTITDSNGGTYAVTLRSTMKTLGNVIDEINRVTPDTITARINDDGNGIIIEDSAGGPDRMVIEEAQGGRTAADLNLAQTARAGESFIDGAFAVQVDINASDTLGDVVDAINAANAGVTAAIINTGDPNKPFSMTITSDETGRAGEMVVDASGSAIRLSTLSEAKDAVVVVGSGDSVSPVLITSSSNQTEDVIDGMSLNLLEASDEAVTVTVAQDVDSIVGTVRSFVDAYNDVQATIDDATAFDSETLERGPLMGDRAVNQVRLRLHRLMLGKFDGMAEGYSYLHSVGLRVGSNNQLELDEEEFLEAYENNPEAVERLFTKAENGFGAILEETIEEMTRDTDGFLALRSETLLNQQDLLNARIDSLTVLLGNKQARLENQFIGLETALADLQAQQSSLTALAQLASS